MAKSRWYASNMNDAEKPSSGNLTHKQLVEQVLDDPVVRGAVASNPRVIRARRQYAENASGLLAELADLGFAVDSVGGLSRYDDYKAAVPALLRWLPRVSYLPLAEDIVRTLSVGFAKSQAVTEFLNLFRKPPEVEQAGRPESSPSPVEHLRWVIGNGLGVFAGPSIADALIELALDCSFGAARTEIVRNLPKTKDPRVPEVLRALLDDPTVRVAAVAAFGTAKDRGTRDLVAALLADPDKSMRDQAKKALKRIDGRLVAGLSTRPLQELGESIEVSGFPIGTIPDQAPQ